MAAAITAIVGGLVSAGGSILGGKSAGDDAKTVQKRAIAMQRQAANLLGNRASFNLDLPKLHLSDLRFSPDQLDTFSESLRTATSQDQFNAALREIGQTFFPDALRATRTDIRVAEEVLPEALAATKRTAAADVEARVAAQEEFAPGTAERRRATLEGLNSMLNFEVPEELQQQLNRQSVERAFRTGQVTGPTAAFSQDQLTYDTLRNNFFAAVAAGQTEQQLTQSAVGDLRLSFAPASTLDLELANLQTRTQAELLNFQNLVNERIQQFGTEEFERKFNFERQDQIALGQANLLVGQGNALTSQATQLSQNASQLSAQGFQTLGQTIGQIDFGALTRGVRNIFTPSGPDLSFDRPPPAVSFDPSLPVVPATVAS